jgi:hypothetical protein
LGGRKKILHTPSIPPEAVRSGMSLRAMMLEDLGLALDIVGGGSGVHLNE